MSETTESLRQSKIDEELFEVVSGFEALSRSRSSDHHIDVTHKDLIHKEYEK